MDSIAQWTEALSALPKLCGSWHLQEAAAAIPIGANVRLRLVSLLQSPYLQSLKSNFNSRVQGLVFRSRPEEGSVGVYFRNVINVKLILLQNPVLKKKSLNVFFRICNLSKCCKFSSSSNGSLVSASAASSIPCETNRNPSVSWSETQYPKAKLENKPQILDYRVSFLVWYFIADGVINFMVKIPEETKAWLALDVMMQEAIYVSTLQA